MARIYLSRKIPEAGLKLLREAGHEFVIYPEDRVIPKAELLSALREGKYDAFLCQLTDTVDKDVFEAAGPQCKIFANYAVGYNNIDVEEAKKRGVIVTNTPDVLTNTVAEYAVAVMLAITHRVGEAERFIRAGKYGGWAPELLLGNNLSGKVVGIVGLGRIGSRVAYHLTRGFDAKIIYYDIKQNMEFEREFGAVWRPTIEELLKGADFVSIHVPLLDSTRHLINAERLAMMKPTSYLINTSRGPVVDETALVEALKAGTIRGAAIDVFENEPKTAPGLAELENVLITPHIASATEETRGAMAELAAKNIVSVLSGGKPLTPVKS